MLLNADMYHGGLYHRQPLSCVRTSPQAGTEKSKSGACCMRRKSKICSLATLLASSLDMQTASRSLMLLDLCLASQTPWDFGQPLPTFFDPGEARDVNAPAGGLPRAFSPPAPQLPNPRPQIYLGRELVGEPALHATSPLPTYRRRDSPQTLRQARPAPHATAAAARNANNGYVQIAVPRPNHRPVTPIFPALSSFYNPPPRPAGAALPNRLPPPPGFPPPSGGFVTAFQRPGDGDAPRPAAGDINASFYNALPVARPWWRDVSVPVAADGAARNDGEEGNRLQQALPFAPHRQEGQRQDQSKFAAAIAAAKAELA
jgi:hypothetical protein